MLERQTQFLTLMEEAKLTKSDVAKAVGVTEETVWQWSQGRKRPNAKISKQIAKLFNCSPNELWG